MATSPKNALILSVTWSPIYFAGKTLESGRNNLQQMFELLNLQLEGSLHNGKDKAQNMATLIKHLAQRADLHEINEDDLKLKS